MDLSRYRPGEEIPAGTVYRRIPNWGRGYFNHQTGRPGRVAFQPRPQDNGALSVHPDYDDAMKALAAEPRHHGFGLCSLDIEHLKYETGARVEFDPNPGNPRHLRIVGCAALAVQVTLARLAEVIHPPTER